MSDQYHDDFYAWASEQAALLRAGNLSAADAANIAEEIEGMGHSLRDQLTNRLGVLLAHLLKWHYQPSHRGNSWRLTIREQRRRASRLLSRNPSLRHDLADIFPEAYGDALLIAARETGLAEATFPAACPWTFETVIQDDFWPEPG